MSFTKTQAPTLENRERNKDHIVSQLFVQGTRLYTSFHTKDDYARFILSSEEGSNTCNELLYGDCKTFLDLDCPLQLSELGFPTVSDFQKKFTDFLITSYKTHLGLELRKAQVLWCTSCRETKTSFHIVISNDEYSWKKNCIYEKLRIFVKILADETLDIPGFHYLSEKNNEIVMYSLLDTGIYHNNRTFRTLHCTKPESNVRFQAIQDGKILPVSHSLIVKYLVTETEEKKTYTLLTERKTVSKNKLKRSLLEKLARKYGSTVHKVTGSLVQLRNLKETRVCPINQEINTTDNSWIIKKNGCLFLGCHNENCQGKLLKIHEFDSVFKYYTDFEKILKMPVEQRTRNLVQEYLRNTCTFIDVPGKGFFVTSREVPCKAFDGFTSKETVICSKLFSGSSNVKVTGAGGNVISFSDELLGLVQGRNMTIKSGVEWKPHLQDSESPSENFNTFSGYVLDNDIETNINFKETAIYELLERLTNHDEESIEYLLSFIAAKLQKPKRKAPISLCWIKTKQGCGKGTFKKFLENLFYCNEDVMISYNRMSQFVSQYNSEWARALWICLEEVSTKKQKLFERVLGSLERRDEYD